MLTLTKMKLITQPDQGLKPLLAAIKRARKRLTIVIFRFDLDALEDALAAAVARGVEVVALIAHTNKGGEDRLRKLEQRLLKKGVTVNRTDDDMVRYHGKLLVVDRREAHILGFNFTRQDLESRSFGVIVRNRRVIKELLRLFEADANRVDYTPQVKDLVVSPENARRRLEAFLRKARVSLDIYDPNVADDRMLALLQKKAARGVTIRILGALEKKWQKAKVAKVRPLRGVRLHVRAIVRDGDRAFIGSQSLRKLELDDRREVGIIIRERDIVRQVAKVFNRDWKRAASKKEKEG
jgi:cardiolipin synthase A/B